MSESTTPSRRTTSEINKTIESRRARAMRRPNYELVEMLLEPIFPAVEADEVCELGEQLLTNFSAVIEDWRQVLPVGGEGIRSAEVLGMSSRPTEWRKGSHEAGSHTQIFRNILSGITEQGESIPALSNYLSGHVARSLEWMADSGQADEELQVDLAIMIFNRLNGDARWLNRVARMLLPNLWLILSRKEARDSGWVTSLISLGVICSALRNRLTIPTEKRFATVFSIPYYQQALACVAGSAWPDEGAAPQLPITSESLSQAANNLAACLAELAQGDNGQTTAAYQEVMKALGNLSVGAVRRRGVAVPEARNPLDELGVKLPEGVRVADALDVMDRMMMVTAMVGLEKGRRQTGWIYLCAATARAALQVGDRVGAAFFNAGIELRRIQKSAAEGAVSVAQPGLLPFLALFSNALGLFWALVSHRELVEALGKGDGLDCAVNLLGIAQELSEGGGAMNAAHPGSGERLLDALLPLYRALMEGCMAHSSVLNAEDVARVAMTAQKIWSGRLTTVAPADDLPRTLPQALQEVLEVLGVDPAFPWDSPRACAQVLAGIFDRIFGAGYRLRDNETLVELVKRFIGQPADLSALVSENYSSALFAPMVAVATGLVPEQEWGQLRPEFFPADLGISIGEAFHQAFSIPWEAPF